MVRDISQAAKATVAMKAQRYPDQVSWRLIGTGLEALTGLLAGSGLCIGETSVQRLFAHSRTQIAVEITTFVTPRRRKGPVRGTLISRKSAGRLSSINSRVCFFFEKIKLIRFLTSSLKAHEFSFSKRTIHLSLKVNELSFMNTEIQVG
jgi:hypothetical protein